MSVTNSDDHIVPLLGERFKIVRAGINSAELFAYLEGLLVAKAGADTQVVALVGGPGSGKSTISRSLIESLSGDKLTADVISTDDYNVGDRAWRWEHFEGDEVRDPLGKWNFAFMNDKIRQIKENKDPSVRIKVPTYDSATGIAIDADEDNYTHAVGPVDVLIVEGDMLKVDKPDLAIYLHLADEERLKNRVGRDLQHRNTNGEDVQKITDNFNLRQHNQFFPYTLPAVDSSDLVIWAKPTDAEWRYDVFERQA